MQTTFQIAKETLFGRKIKQCVMDIGKLLCFVFSSLKMDSIGKNKHSVIEWLKGSNEIVIFLNMNNNIALCYIL